MTIEVVQTRSLDSRPARWTDRMIRLAEIWNRETDTERRREALDEFWLLLITVLCTLLRSYGRRFGQNADQEFRDLAVDKSLDLIRKFQHGEWTPAAMSSSQLYSFVATVARNGLIDHVRTDKTRADGLKELFRKQEGAGSEERLDESAGDAMARLKFKQALADCSARLTPRARRIWFLRIFYELPSRLIARHIEVQMSAPAVDVSVSRARAAVKRCLADRGLDASSIPVGTFLAIWSELAARSTNDRESRKP